MSPDTSMQRLLDACEPHVAAVEQHPLFDSIQTPTDVRRFMEAHVFAVWDFMSLLTALQVRTTGCTVPWRPTGDAALRRFVNEIKLEEESDELPDGRVLSHFERRARPVRARSFRRLRRPVRWRCPEGSPAVSRATNAAAWAGLPASPSR